MNVAMSERLRKQENPADFCTDKKCLWRVVTTRGVKPCPKHMPGSYAKDDIADIATDADMEQGRREAGPYVDEYDDVLGSD